MFSKETKGFSGDLSLCRNCGAGCVYVEEGCVGLYACKACERVYLVPCDESDSAAEETRWMALGLAGEMPADMVEIRRDWIR